MIKIIKFDQETIPELVTVLQDKIKVEVIQNSFNQVTNNVFSYKYIVDNKELKTGDYVVSFNDKDFIVCCDIELIRMITGKGFDVKTIITMAMNELKASKNDFDKIAFDKLDESIRWLNMKEKSDVRP